MSRPEMFRAVQLTAATIILCAAQLLAPAQTPDSARRKADELFKVQKWAEAAEAYEAIVKAEPDDAAAWSQLASARYSLGQFAAAAAAFQKNTGLTKDPVAMFKLACVYARLNEKKTGNRMARPGLFARHKTFLFLLAGLERS